MNSAGCLGDSRHSVEQSLSTWGFAPPVDIYEDANKLVFKMEISGMEEKDLEVEVEGNVLTVSGDRKLEKEGKEEQFRRKERHYGAFSRSFTYSARWIRERSKPIT
jgi:HSP20 family protein